MGSREPLELYSEGKLRQVKLSRLDITLWVLGSHGGCWSLSKDGTWE
jgi:hypothetical protein